MDNTPWIFQIVFGILQAFFVLALAWLIALIKGIAELNAYHQDIIEYAYKNRVWITSPTTLMSMLTVVQTVIKNMERDKYAAVIQKELQGLSVEFSRYKERWDTLQRSIDKVSRDVKEVNVTTEKITSKFESINRVEVEKFIETKKED